MAAPDPRLTPSPLRNAVRLILSALPIAVVIAFPWHPDAFDAATLAEPPLELPAVLFLLLAAGRLRAVRAVVVAALLLLFAQKVAELAMRGALGRPFNPVGDLPLADAMLRLLSGAVGLPLTVALVAAVALGLAGLGWLLWWATGVWGHAMPSARTRAAAGVACAVAAAVVVADVGARRGAWDLPDLPGTTATGHMVTERVAMARETLRGVRDFAALVDADPYRGLDGLLDVLDRDLVVIFVESYGRTSLDTPLYADTHRATLAAAEARLADLGLSMRSGVLASPTQGGRSWLAHETFGGGLWTDDQARYLAALSSGRETLYAVAARSGLRTAAVMPAITLDWPESGTMGFDRVLAAADLGYRGAPFNWVTMPDQYTLSALDRLVRDADDRRPAVVQVALVSSHAPWTPVPDLLPWDAVGDGRVFDAMATAGDPPRVVWADRDRVRDQYRLSIDYALRTVFDYAALHADDPPLILVLGDHQTAESIALDARPDVPAHLIGPEALVDRAADWGWTPGLIPDDDATAVPMSLMRNRILSAFSTGAPEAAAPAGAGADGS